jgi:hypothetical protein
MLIALLIAFAAATSIFGAILNGYGAAKHHHKILRRGQISWVISNTTWVSLYALVPEAVISLPVVFQLLTFGTFLLCALYAVFAQP